jgi:hypothetical protein
MHIVVGLVGFLLILVVLLDGFETVLLPRRVAHAFRFTSLYYRTVWPLWKFLSRFWRQRRRRDGFLSMFGPLSMLGLLAAWVAALIFGFTLLYWSSGDQLHANQEADFGTYLYLSGVTFFTLGYGDVTPQGPLGRTIAVVEAGGGFGFLALLIGYVPVFYQAFSRREISISLLDARAGSPPSAGQFLLRMANADRSMAHGPFLSEWERWSAELLESHLSFPFLSFYRSQHDNQSWLATLTYILDTSAILIAAVKGPATGQAQLTFAMARHAAVDLALVFQTPPRRPEPERLTADQCQRLHLALLEAGLKINDGPAVQARLVELRGMYEPFLTALADFFVFAMPPIWPENPAVDNWQTSAWMKRTIGFDGLLGPEGEDHPV